MEPKRMLAAVDFSSSRGKMKKGSYVWAIDESSAGRVLVEVGDQRFEVPTGVLVDTPVPAPIEKLTELDECFRGGLGALKEIHVNHEWLFRVLECEHANLFLEDTVSGIAWYSRLIFMGDRPRDPVIFYEFWRRHKHLSNDQIHLMGIGIG